MNIAIRSLIHDLEELVRNGSDVASLATDLLDKYREELPNVEYSVSELLDGMYQRLAGTSIKDKGCKLFKLVSSAPFFELIIIDLTQGDNTTVDGNYEVTVAANNTGSGVAAYVECKFCLYSLNLDEQMRIRTGANKLAPHIISFSLMIYGASPFSLNLIDMGDASMAI